MKQIHQFIAGAAVGDAITNYAFEIKSIFNKYNIKSEIFSPYQHTAPELREAIIPIEKVNEYISNDCAVIYHFSIGSPATEIFKNLKCKKILCYHNITPEKYFRSISDQRARVLMEGREELKNLATIPDITLAVSNFNAKELIEFGFKSPQVIPLTINDSYLRTKPSRKIQKMLDGNFINFLFVGRVSPNKKLEDVIKVFYYYNKTINSASRLFFAGSYVGMEKYLTYLKSLASEMKLQNVKFTGHISLEELLGYYKASTLFLCMSEHEGVCIPLIESMYFDKPVFALARAAIPETMGNAGILINTKNYIKIAELIDIVINNEKMLKKIKTAQKERIKYFLKNNLEKRLDQIFKFSDEN